MTDCRDWLTTMLPGSLNGVPFQCDGDEIQGGRRVSVHEFTNRDDPFNEDLGGQAQPVKVNAYVHGDDGPSRASALFAMCNTRGPLTLVLPLLGVHRVHCLNVRQKNDYKKLGVIKVTMEFIKDTGVTGGLIASINPIRNSQILASTARTVVANAFSDRYNAQDRVVNGVTDIAMNKVADEIRYMSALGSVVSDGITMVQDNYAEFTTLGRDLMNNATRLSRQITKFADVRRERTDADAQPAYASAGLATVNYLAELNAAATDNRTLFFNAAEAILAVEDPKDLEPDLTHASITRRSIATLLRFYRIVARQSLAITAMQAAAEAASDIKTRSDARFIRARMGDVTDAVIGEAESQEEIEALTQLRGQAAEAIIDGPVLGVDSFRNDRGRDENNVGRTAEIVVEANKQLPATYWSWRLYGDPERATELVERNGTPHPSFMPYEFEALAK